MITQQDLERRYSLVQSISWQKLFEVFNIEAEEQLKLKVRSTGVIVMLCPFHKEETPSLVCWPRSKNWRCHGCDRGGDMVDFLHQWLNVDLEDVLQFLESFHERIRHNHPDQLMLFE